MLFGLFISDGTTHPKEEVNIYIYSHYEVIGVGIICYLTSSFFV